MTIRPFAIKAVTVLAIIGAVAAVDAALADMERSETAQDARQYYEEGGRLLRQGRAASAVDSLQRAHALDRRNPLYELQLISALIAAHRTDEARADLDTVLLETPDNGQANLLMARLLGGAGKADQAEVYYHRAIYGEWPDDADRRRIEVRVELIKLLAARGQQRELLSELLPLQSEAAKDAAIQKQIASWLIAAGAPTRAIDLYRDLIRQSRHDPDLYMGLGQANLEVGDYQAAVAAFANAARRRPDDAAVHKKLDLAREAASLDPTPRWLSTREKYDRSTRILELVQDAARQCGSTEEPRTSPEPKRPTNEDAEARLAQAEQLWSARGKTCPVPDQLRPLQLVIEKLSGLPARSSSP